MEYILIFLLGILASSKTSFQSAFGKKYIKNSTDSLTFNIFVFIVATLLFLPQVFSCSNVVWIYAAAGATFTLAFQLIYTKALSIGNVSLTVLIMNFSMVINVLVSYFVFGEAISLIRFIAIIITVISFITCSGVKKEDNVNRKWLLFAVLAMVLSSCGSIVQKFFGESAYGSENQAFVSCLYLVSAVFGLVIYPFMQKREKRSFKINFSLIKHAVGVGVSLALFQMLYTYCLANIDGTFIFPAQTGGAIIFSTLAGVLIFKDRFTKRQIFGVILGIISLVMMSY